ncbi:related to choline monooxygenase [Fusarium fujikuroi]|nr:related to choline monooxygenase [Fusarium fujikuroi]
MDSFIFLCTTSALVASIILYFWRHLQRSDACVVPGHRTFDLPEGWLSDPVRFQLERRAIFSQTWICLSHRGRFCSPGDYVVYDVAGFHILMILGKDQLVRSFHNVCRHRAFPVARKQSGSATVLGCRYHGWSYNTEGKLIKAPYFDNLPGFDKTLNSLFPVHTKKDSKGFLHINVSGHEDVSAPATSMGAERRTPGDIGPDTELLDSIELSGKFNWKLILDQPYDTSNPTKYSISNYDRSLRPVRHSSIESQLFFPLTTIHTMSGKPFWYQLTYSPVAVDHTNLRCDIYINSPKGSFQLEGTTKDSLQKELQQKLLAFENQHKQLTTQGEKGFADAAEMHRRREAVRGFEIKPAALKQQNGNATLSKAERICQAVDCGNSRMLDW